MKTLNEIHDEVSKDLFEALELKGGIAKKCISIAIKRTIREVIEVEREACIRAAASPDEGYLHGCDCRSRIRARDQLKDI